MMKVAEVNSWKRQKEIFPLCDQPSSQWGFPCAVTEFVLQKRKYNNYINGLRFLKVTLFVFEKIIQWIFWSSCPKVFCKKSDPKNLTNSQGKYFCRNFIFAKIVGLRFVGCNFTKKMICKRLLLDFDQKWISKVNNILFQYIIYIIYIYIYIFSFFFGKKNKNFQNW